MDNEPLTTKAKRENFQLSLRKTNQSELISQKRENFNRAPDTNEMAKIRAFIASGNIANVQNETCKLALQFIGTSKFFDITDAQAMSMLIDISAHYDCRKIFGLLTNEQSTSFFQKVVSNTYMRINAASNIHLLINIFYDDFSEAFLTFLVDRFDLLSIILSHLDEKVERVLIDLSLQLIAMIAHKNKITTNHDFILNLLEAIEVLLDKPNMTDSIHNRGVVLAGHFISNFIALVNIEDYKVIQLMTIRLFQSLAFEGEMPVGPTVGVVQILTTMINSYKEPRKTVDLAVNVLTIPEIAKLFRSENKIVRKYAFWMLSSILCDFDNQPECRDWEPHFKLFADAAMDAGLNDFDVLAKNGLRVLQYFLRVLSEEFINMYFTKDLSALMDYFHTALRMPSPSVMEMQLELLDVAIDKISVLANAIVNDDLMVKVIEDLQTHSYARVAEKASNIIVNKLSES